MLQKANPIRTLLIRPGFPRLILAIIAGLSFVADSGKGADPDEEISQLIQSAYTLSTQAKNPADFEKVETACQQASKKELSESQQRYIEKLRSWAIVKNFQTQIELRTTNNGKSTDEDSKAFDFAAWKSRLDLAIKLDTTSWNGLTCRAYCHRQCGDRENAVLDLDSAIRLRPKEGKLWFNRAELYFQLGKLELAVSDYSEAIKIDEADVQAMTGRAHCYLRLKKFDLAVADYSVVVRKSPRNPTSWLNRADAYLIMKQYKPAGEDYREALTRDQSISQAYCGVAWMYATSEKQEFRNKMIAEKAIKRAIELDGKETAETLVILAASQAAAGDFSMARDTIARVKKLEQSPRCRRRIRFLESEKWFRAGAGQKK